MILPVGEWVIRRACEQARARQLAGMKPLRVAVNISINQFKEQNFFNLVENILNETGLAPKYLELEITESILINNVNEAFKILCQLNELGVQLAIDDFGTGYSSLSRLTQFPISRLKIDRSFVQGMERTRELRIARLIVDLAKALNLEVIAEGVETVEQREALLRIGCHRGQGWLFARAMPVSELLASDKPVTFPAE